MFDNANYYRLEYLQTGGTQRIDTGIKGYCEFEIDFQLTSPGTAGHNSFFGSRQDGATNRFGCFNYNNIFHFMTGTGSTWNIAVDTNRHLIHFNSSVFTDNGTEYAVSVPGGSYGSSNFWLMWCNGLGGGGNGYWYYAKFWDSNGNLIRDYIPAQRKSDSVLGMYDTVNNTFTTNGGSGSFTAGQIVNELKITPNPSDGGEITATLSLSFDYTGAIQTFTVPKSGNYKLEAYGGSGGGTDNTHGYGGKGGYASGTKYLEKNTVLYIVCGGGNGKTYNGGGNGNRTAYSGTGGGATHIATVTGTLSSIGASNLNKILIVAGGGGGGGYNGKYGGDGGGLTGEDGTGSYYGMGGTQTAGGKNYYYKSQTSHATFGSFGKGGNAETGLGSSDSDAGGGGGGLYGGGGGSWSSSNTANGAGGGGSSYIDNLTDGHTESGVNEGNGYAIITFVPEEELFPSGTELTLEAIPNSGYDFSDWTLLVAKRFVESDTVTTPAFTYSGFSWASWVSTYGAGLENNYITVDFQAPVIITEYEGTNHNDSSSIAWSFTIAGSDDNVTYTDIQTDAFPAKAFQTVTVNNTTAYRYYRLIYSSYNNSYRQGRYVYANLSFFGYTVSSIDNNPLALTLDSDTDIVANFERSANCRFKVNGEWKFAMMYVKVNGQWQQGLVRIKKNGSWKEGG